MLYALTFIVGVNVGVFILALFVGGESPPNSQSRSEMIQIRSAVSIISKRVVTHVDTILRKGEIMEPPLKKE